MVTIYQVTCRVALYLLWMCIMPDLTLCILMGLSPSPAKDFLGMALHVLLFVLEGGRGVVVIPKTPAAVLMMKTPQSTMPDTTRLPGF